MSDSGIIFLGASEPDDLLELVEAVWEEEAGGSDGAGCSEVGVKNDLTDAILAALVLGAFMACNGSRGGGIDFGDGSQ